MERSIEKQERLELTGYEVTLTKGAIKLKKRQCLEIHGGIIQGNVHSLFQIDGCKPKQNPKRLRLVHVTLRHTKVHEDPREIGAAIFVMGNGDIEVRDCDISSKGGFGIWAKHEATVTIDHCYFHSIQRTAIACFNNVHVTIGNQTRMHTIGIHGICSRGTSKVTIDTIHIDACAIRAIMVYQGSTLWIQDSIITNTDDPTTSTIYLQGPPMGDSPTTTRPKRETENLSNQPIRNDKENEERAADPSLTMMPSLTMIRCIVKGNAGPPLLVEGQVLKQEFVDTTFED